MIWPIGGGSPEENTAEVSAKLQEGYRSFHVKIGAFHPDKDVARVAAIRETVGNDIPLMLDANQGWDYLTARRTIPRLEQFVPSMVEQPVPAWDRQGMQKIQASVSTAISADESLHSLRDAVDLIRRDAARVFSLKTAKCGGLFRARQIAAVAEGADCSCFVNSMLEMGVSVAASLHLAATLPNLVDHGHALMSNLRIKRDILKDGSFQYEGRDILIPTDRPGLGIQIDEDELESRTLEKFVAEL
jgi:muconate cycloisomerase